MKRRLTSSLCILSALLIASCGTTKLSKIDRDEVDSGRKAIVKTYNQPLLASMVFEEMPVVRIMSIDGRDVDPEMFKLDDQIALDLGVHEIEFSCSARGGYDERDFTETIKLDLRPHHEYLVRCSFDSRYGAGGSYTASFSVKEKSLE